jgi:hypothetical protein
MTHIKTCISGTAWGVGCIRVYVFTVWSCRVAPFILQSFHALATPNKMVARLALCMSLILLLVQKLTKIKLTRCYYPHWSMYINCDCRSPSSQNISKTASSLSGGKQDTARPLFRDSRFPCGMDSSCAR